MNPDEVRYSPRFSQRRLHFGNPDSSAKIRFMKHPNKITLIKPDDFHLHLRQGDYLKTTVIHSAERFARAIVMPNLKPPVTTVEAALSYRQEILKFVPSGLNFQRLLLPSLQPKKVNPLLVLNYTQQEQQHIQKQALLL
jgi:dihydroorotase